MQKVLILEYSFFSKYPSLKSRLEKGKVHIK